LVANASSGAWDLAIDQTIEGAEKWFAQIESPSLYLYFQLADLQRVRDALRFIGSRRANSNNLNDSCPSNSAGELALGSFVESPVTLIWDEEYRDRLFLIVGQSSDACLRCSISGVELDQLTDALRKLVQNLDSAA